MESILTFRALGLYGLGCMRNPFVLFRLFGVIWGFCILLLDSGYLTLDAKGIGLELELEWKKR
jgi:hypothetical protein